MPFDTDEKDLHFSLRAEIYNFAKRARITRHWKLMFAFAALLPVACSRSNGRGRSSSATYTERGAVNRCARKKRDKKHRSALGTPEEEGRGLPVDLSRTSSVYQETRRIKTDYLGIYRAVPCRPKSNPSILATRFRVS